MPAGDYGSVSIGKNTNVQDNVFIGATSEYSPNVVIGDNVSVGHGAVLKGCAVGANTLVGVGAVISEGAKVRTAWGPAGCAHAMHACMRGADS
jgi:carbonic anhydrase/acetyltransferase-like protein (isoleucine patch superfamily)